MKMPRRLEPLLRESLIDDVEGQLQSGKEAEVYVVRCGEELRCAKVYKEANNRTFKAKTQYTEGRQTRNSRRSRAMESNSRYGRQERESEWQNTEVEALAVLAAAGVRVPQTYGYYEGVLILQMVTDATGQPAPRLNDVDMTTDQARQFHAFLIRQVVLMLCAGLVHGDLSEFNVLLAHDGLMIIDLPQAVQATANNAYEILARDVNHMRLYFGRLVPEILATEYPQEIWKLYKTGKLKPDSPLTGRFEGSKLAADVRGILDEIDDARDEAMEKRGVRKP